MTLLVVLVFAILAWLVLSTPLGRALIQLAGMLLGILILSGFMLYLAIGKHFF